MAANLLAFVPNVTTNPPTSEMNHVTPGSAASLTEQSVPYNQNSRVILVDAVFVPPCWNKTWWDDILNDLGANPSVLDLQIFPPSTPCIHLFCLFFSFHNWVPSLNKIKTQATKTTASASLFQTPQLLLMIDPVWSHRDGLCDVWGCWESTPEVQGLWSAETHIGWKVKMQMSPHQTLPQINSTWLWRGWVRSDFWTIWQMDLHITTDQLLLQSPRLFILLSFHNAAVQWWQWTLSWLLQHQLNRFNLKQITFNLNPEWNFHSYRDLNVFF